MEIEIQQGVPKHGFFAIAKPKKRYEEPLEPGKTVVKLKNPKTKDEYQAIYHGHWDFTETEFDTAKCFSLLVYGCGPKFLKTKLMELYPELNTEFKLEYWLLQKI